MSKELYTANNKRIAKNTLYLYFRMLLIMGVTLYTSRIVLNALGVEDFGIYNIVGGVVILFSFINNALSSATQRFLNFEIGRGDVLGTKRVFSMSLTIHLFVALFVVLLAETVGLWFLNTQMNIPTERMAAANLVYQFSILTVCISFVQIPYYASVVAYEKMSFFAYIAIIEVILKLLIVVLLIYVGFDKLRLYSILTFLVAVLVFVCYKYYCNTRLDISRYKYFWDKILFSKLLNFSGWMLFGAAAGVSATQGVNILLNIFYGVTVNAAMGINSVHYLQPSSQCKASHFRGNQAIPSSSCSIVLLSCGSIDSILQQQTWALELRNSARSHTKKKERGALQILKCTPYLPNA